MLADRGRRRPRCSARSPTRRTRRCSTPTAPCCRGAGARGRAGTSTCWTSRRPDDRDLPHEPPPVAARRARVLRDAEPHGGDRPGSVIRVIAYHHPVYTPGRPGRAAALGRGERRAPHPLLRRLLGLRLPRGRRGVGAARVRALREAARVSASALYEGWVRHRRHEPVEHEFRYRLFMAYLDLDELPEVLDGVPLWSARRPAPAWFRRGGLPRGRTRRAGAPAHARAHLRPPVQPGEPLLLLRSGRRAGRAGARRGDQHAVGRAPHVPAGAADADDRQGSSRLALPGNGLRVPGPDDDAGRQLRVHMESPRRSASTSTRRWRSRDASSRPGRSSATRS